MFNTLQRYIMRQFVFSVVCTVALFVVILITGNAVKDVLPLLSNGKISFNQFAQIMMYLIPSLISYALPFGILTATLLVLGRLSSQNELIAMKSSGLSLTSIVAPILFCATLGTIFTLFVNFFWGQKAIVYHKIAINKAVQGNPEKFIQNGVFVKDFSGYVFYIGDIDGNKMTNCCVIELNDNQISGRNLEIKSKHGMFDYDKNTNSIILTLLDGVGEKFATTNQESVSQFISFKSTEIKFPLNKIALSIAYNKQIKHMNLLELMNIKNIYKKSPRGSFGYSQKIKANLEIKKNAVMSFSAFVLVLIAIPLSIKMNRQETSINLIIAIILALSFYFIVIAISWLELLPQWHPEILLMLQLVLFQIFGIFLFVKARKH